jgi:hypothetical protein
LCLRILGEKNAFAHGRFCTDSTSACPSAPAPEQAPEAVNEALNDIAARREAERSTGEAAGGEARKSWQERLAAAQQKQPAAGKDFAEKLAKIRKAQEQQEAEETRRKAARRGPTAGPEQGHRGPSL